jgi:alkanesulfonate monooxygenase SsuD/methylene tetrahydromethanopterin reductase-like flavin-dependent oxidoreductase (luciferase family)
VLDSIGRGELQTELNRLSMVGPWDEMGRRIDDEVLDAFAVVGEPHEIAAKIEQRYGGIFDRLLGGAPPGDPSEIERLRELQAI